MGKTLHQQNFTQNNFLQNILCAPSEGLRRSLMGIAAFSALFGYAACGSSSSGDDFTMSSRVVDLFVEQNVLAPGEGSVVRVDFSFDADDVFEDDEAVVLVVRLPRETQYRDNTSEVDSVGSDRRIGARVRLCDSGETLLTYVIDRDDLARAINPDGDADARVTFTFNAVEATAISMISAKGDVDDNATRCDQPFTADRDANITITS